MKKEIHFINPLANGELTLGEYFGETVNGVPQGSGTIKQKELDSNFTVYGEFIRGKLHGIVSVF